MWFRCTSSGPSARHSVRDREYACVNGKSSQTPPPCTWIALDCPVDHLTGHIGGDHLDHGGFLLRHLFPTVSIIQAALRTNKRAWSISIRALAIRSRVTPGRPTGGEKRHASAHTGTSTSTNVLQGRLFAIRLLVRPGSQARPGSILARSTARRLEARGKRAHVAAQMGKNFLLWGQRGCQVAGGRAVVHTFLVFISTSVSRVGWPDSTEGTSAIRSSPPSIRAGKRCRTLDAAWALNVQDESDSRRDAPSIRMALLSAWPRKFTGISSNRQRRKFLMLEAFRFRCDESRAFWYHAVLEVASQRDQQLSCQCNHADVAHAQAPAGEAPVVPLAERAPGWKRSHNQAISTIVARTR